MTMTDSQQFPQTPNANDIYQAIVECGKGRMKPEVAAKALADFFRPLLPCSAGKRHAEFLGEYVGASLVGNLTIGKDEALRLCKIGWENGYKIQEQADIKVYRP